MFWVSLSNHDRSLADRPVWAKMISYPYFPGLVMDPVEDEKQIPDAVKEREPKGEEVWLVRFFDSQSSFGWIPRNRLDLLGALDGEFSPWLSSGV